MKRVEVKLSLPVVAPLLDVIRELSAELEKTLAAPQALHDLDQEFRGAWIGELIQGQNDDLRTLLSLFDAEFATQGIVAFDEANAEPIVRACTAFRLFIRERRLKSLPDEALETGDVEMAGLDESVRTAFMCYLFLATVQELIIQHLESSIVGS
ncbi:MAG TPA: hypothetical protein VGG34_03105 [Opitutaceae bacterium]|jgi:hypothetical protein